MSNEYIYDEIRVTERNTSDGWFRFDRIGQREKNM